MEENNLRDFYAGLAMMGLLSAGNPASGAEGLAGISFDVADAMMEERSARYGQADGGDGQSL